MNKKELYSALGTYRASKRWKKMSKKQRSAWAKNVLWVKRRANKALQGKEK